MVSLIFWAGVYAVGRHPDVTWGDGIGYALSIRHGYDFAINANSHFLYLNFHRLLMNVTGCQNSMTFLSWASVGWCMATLYMVYRIGELLKSKSAGLVSLHLLAVCFPFWRHACIIEVYAMELFFWGLCVYGWVQWFQNGRAYGAWILVLAHAVGLLIHIHFLLLFPALIFSFAKKRDFQLFWLLPYLVSASVIFFCVYVWEINTLEEVFFDSIPGQMLHFDLFAMAKGLGVTVFLLIVLFPLGTLILFRRLGIKGALRMVISDESGSQPIGILMLTLIGFCIPYPSAGIYVFLLPVYLIWAVGSGVLLENLGALHHRLPGKVLVILLVQVLFFVGVKWSADHFFPSSLRPDLEAKGGWGYYIYPWANGNAPSLLEATRQGKVPPDLEWNKLRARLWLRDDSLNH